MQFNYLSVTLALASLAFGSTLEAQQLSSIRSQAADADLGFFMAFLNDYNSGYQRYTSYMINSGVALPQEVANYYYHLATVRDDADLELDIIKTFPFTQFQTFITQFPWYSSLLTEASATTIYLPDYFLSNSVTDSSAHEQVTLSSPPSSTAVSNNSSSITQMSSVSSSLKSSSSSNHSKNATSTRATSHNGASALNMITPVSLIMFLITLFM